MIANWCETRLTEVFNVFMLTYTNRSNIYIYIYIYVVSLDICEVKIVAQGCIQKISDLSLGFDSRWEFRYFLNTSLSNNLYFIYNI
jgi:hypothetical protein